MSATTWRPVRRSRFSVGPLEMFTTSENLRGARENEGGEGAHIRTRVGLAGGMRRIGRQRLGGALGRVAYRYARPWRPWNAFEMIVSCAASCARHGSGVCAHRQLARGESE